MTEEQLTPSATEDNVTGQEAPVTTVEGVAPSPEAAAPVAEVSAPAADAPTEKPAAGEAIDDALLFEQAFAALGNEDARESGIGTLTRGERIKAKVIQVEKDRVFVDLGTKAEGIVPLNELTEANVTTAVGLVSRDDTFDVIVLKTNSDGSAIVSKRKADFDQVWNKILEDFEAGVVFEANVVDRVKGGLVVDIGVRGFVPATHVGSGKLRNIEKYVGQPLNVKIIEVDRERKKVVLSNKAAEDERRGDVKERLFTDTKAGDILEGTVRRLTDYGAFVDLGGIDGLLHISEMSWYRIDHPREVLKEGDDIKVMVLRLDSGNGRVSLGLRQVLPDPWKQVGENYKAGEKLKLTVTRLVQSGAFVKLPEGVEAFLPLSEMSAERIKKPEEVLTEGQEIEPMIIELRPDDRRMVLSLRPDAKVGGYRFEQGGMGANMRPRGQDGERRGGGDRGDRRGGGGRGRREGGDYEAAPQQPRATPTGGATIGERLGLLKGLMKPEANSEEK